jgi:phosphatidylserine/phosphatidylglycerophosphate/cardiolipin synthase-like enzyme
MTLRSTSGVTVNTGTVSLNPSQQTARFVSELFPGVSNFEGTLELSASRSVAALALRQNLASGIFSTLPVSPTPTEVFFSPNAGTSARIVQEINQAQNTIDIAIYSFTRDEIADALIAAKNRGVTIRILADSGQANGTGSDIARLEAAGFELKRTNGGGGGILHDKYAIFDGRLLVTGSYNWSTNAEENNDENAVFMRSTSVISAFQTNFNSMWSTR